MHQTSFSTETAERISALSDGQLAVDALASTVGDLLEHAQAKQTWLSYHVVGDVLRSAELAPTTSDMAFLARLEQRLAAEPTPLPVPMSSAPLSHASHHSANTGVFRWKMVAGLTGAVLVGVLGLEVFWVTDSQTLREVPVADLGVMVRDPRLDELLDAHRQLGGHSALQMPSGFLRNATYEGAAR